MKTIQALMNSYIFNENKTQIQEYVKEVDMEILISKSIIFLVGYRIMSREVFLCKLLIFFLQPKKLAHFNLNKRSICLFNLAT